MALEEADVEDVIGGLGAELDAGVSLNLAHRLLNQLSLAGEVSVNCVRDDAIWPGVLVGVDGISELVCIGGGLKWVSWQKLKKMKKMLLTLSLSTADTFGLGLLPGFLRTRMSPSTMPRL